MASERERDRRLNTLETDGVLVRPIGGQVYLVEEGSEDDARRDEPPAPGRSPLSGLVSRH